MLMAYDCIPRPDSCEYGPNAYQGAYGASPHAALEVDPRVLNLLAERVSL